MGGAPPPYEVMPSTDIIRGCLGPQLLHFDQGFRGILPSWFEKEYIWAMEQSLDVEVDYSIWAFLSYMFTRSVFNAKSDRVFLNFLPALEDVSRVRTYGWDRSALGWMYSNMGEVANGENTMFLGLHFFWEVRCLLFCLTSLLFFVVL